MLQFLLAGLQEPHLSSVSAQALQSIASMCCDHMKSHFHHYCFRPGVTVPVGRTTRASSIFSVCPGTTEHSINVSGSHESHFHCYCFRPGTTVPVGRTTRASSIFSVCPGTTEHSINVSGSHEVTFSLLLFQTRCYSSCW